MNKKGFTLVELLAVVIILALLATLASTSVINIVKNSKNDLYEAQVELIKVAAETWGAENLDLLPNSGECKYISLNQLKKYGLLDKNIKNPNTNKEFDKYTKIKITSLTTEYGTLNIEYEVNANNVLNCDNVYGEADIFVKNETAYPWSINGENYKSSNHAHSTTSNLTFEFEITQEAELSFDWSVSSESINYDYLYYTIKKAGTTLSGTGTSTKIGGTGYGTSDSSMSYVTVSKTLEPGQYQLVFTYRKDGSVHRGTDTGYVKNIKLKY